MNRLEMWVRGWWRIALAALVGLLWACMPPSGGGDGQAEDCMPGDRVLCRCPMAMDGYRVCDEDGDLGRCQCDDDGGGAGGMMGGGPIGMAGNMSAGGSAGGSGGNTPMLGGMSGAGGNTPGTGGGEPPCEPDCFDLECGPDYNCGLSCGECFDELCIGGRCVPDENEFGFRDVEYIRDTVYVDAPGAVVLYFSGPVDALEIAVAGRRAVLFEGRPNSADEHYFETSWQRVNEGLVFDYGEDGQAVEFIATIMSPTGRADSIAFTLQFLCRGDNGAPAPACDGTCAPNANLGCKCLNGARNACDGDRVVSCAGEFEPLPCDDYLGDGTVRGFCVDDLYDEGAGGCVMRPGDPCYYRGQDDESFYVYCGAEGRVDLDMGCINGVCARGVPECADEDTAYCLQDALVYACLDLHSGPMAIGTSCLDEFLGGEEGVCDRNHCVQPNPGGFCLTPLVACAGEMSCELDPASNDGDHICAAADDAGGE